MEVACTCPAGSGAMDPHTGLVAKTYDHCVPCDKHGSVDDETSHTGDDAFDTEATCERGPFRRLKDVALEAKVAVKHTLHVEGGYGRGCDAAE